MRQSSALEELLLRFISLKENDLDSPLVERTLGAFSNTFDGHRPPLDMPPLGVYNLAVILERLLNTGNELGIEIANFMRYSSVYVYLITA